MSNCRLRHGDDMDRYRILTLLHILNCLGISPSVKRQHSPWKRHKSGNTFYVLYQKSIISKTHNDSRHRQIFFFKSYKFTLLSLISSKYKMFMTQIYFTSTSKKDNLVYRSVFTESTKQICKKTQL